MRQAFVLGIGLLAVAGGCGTTGTATLRPTKPAASVVAPPAPSPLAAQPLGVNEAALEGVALLARVREEFETCTGAEAEATSYSEGHFKAGKRVGELRKATYKTHMIWVKPRKIRGEILQTDNFLVGGATMVTLDGKAVRVKGAGLLGLLPLTLGAKDDLLSSNRHHTFDQQTPDAISRRLLGAEATWTVIGGGAIGGTPVRIVEVAGVPRLDKEITREVIAVDPEEPALRGVSMYVGARKVVEVTFSSFTWNPKPAKGAFDL